MRKIEDRTTYTILLSFSNDNEVIKTVDKLDGLNYNVSYNFDFLIGYVIVPKNDTSGGFSSEYAKEIMHTLKICGIDSKLIRKQYSIELFSYEEI